MPRACDLRPLRSPQSGERGGDPIRFSQVEAAVRVGRVGFGGAGRRCATSDRRRPPAMSRTTRLRRAQTRYPDRPAGCATRPSVSGNSNTRTGEHGRRTEQQSRGPRRPAASARRDPAMITVINATSSPHEVTWKFVTMPASAYPAARSTGSAERAEREQHAEHGRSQHQSARSTPR